MNSNKRKKKERESKNSYLKKEKGKENTLKCKLSKMNLILSIITDK